MQARDLVERLQPPSRSESLLSLSSQSSHYTDEFDEDLSIAIAQFKEEGEDKENPQYGIAGAPPGPSSSAPRFWKRNRVTGEESEVAPPRQIPKTTGTQELTPHKGSGSSRDTRVDSTSSVASSSESSRTLGPTPPALGHRVKPHARKAEPVVAASGRPPVVTPSVGLPTHPHPTHVPSEAPEIPVVPSAWRPPEAVVVAHVGYYAKFIQPLPWGVQWELARYINTGFSVSSLEVLTLIDLRKRGTNVAAAPEVKKIVEKTVKAHPATAAAQGGPDVFATAYARELSVKLPWDELDKEEQMLKDHPFGGIGCNQDEPFCASDPDWFGGRVQFTACVRKEKDGQLKLELERPVLGLSNRFARRFGSRRFIRVRIRKDLQHNAVGDELRDYFRRPFIIGCAVFRAFYAKEQNVFLFRTNEEVGANSRVVQPSPGSAAAQNEYRLIDFLNWHNDLEFNSGQTMVKWAARTALALSNSVPGIRLESRNVLLVDDIVSKSFVGPGKPPSEMQMTDGCGFANRAVMRMLQSRVKFGSGEEEPTAVQFRIAGAKGLLLMRHDLPAAEQEVPTVWLRPSQQKIQHTADALEDPALRTIDVVRASRMHTPARLSVETITNLAENGVPAAYFRRLLEINLQARIDELLKYETVEDMPLLWHAIAREGGVIHARMAREAVGVARAKGLVAEYYDDEDDEDEDGLDGLDKALRDQSSAWWEDVISGCPAGLEETCLTLLDSCFTPKTSAVLRAKLKEVARKVVTTFEARYKFPVPMSCSAFIVPDPCGVLGPNEIHVKSSRRDFSDQNGRQTDLVIGDVLVTRHPCKVPSDVQKVKAVYHEKLRHYCDVIVVSTENHLWQGQSLDRHLASLTGGGDYDGDTMEVFWDPAMVASFKEPDPRLYASEPPEVQQCLVKNTESVSAFLARVPPNTSEEYRIFALQDYLLGALRGRSHVSTYSVWWEKSTYAQGYSHPETVFLAYMFCALLDGIKTGVTVDPVAFSRHQKKWSHGALGWKVIETEGNPLIQVKRNPLLPPFIMDLLAKRVREVCKEQRKRINEKLVTTGVVPLDEDLARPFRDAEDRAGKLEKMGVTLMGEELGRLRRHVEAVYAKAAKVKRAASKGERGKGKGERGGGGGNSKASFTALPIERRQDILREQSKEFHAQPADLVCFSASEATTIKASYAYIYDHTQEPQKWSRFPWDVAMRALCEIKAKACGGSKTVADSFYRYFELSRAYLRQRKQED